ncbi:dermonecrotic toxin domain-containing protein [Izhakiella capsodis]|nr:DUF6543 domain-containing protein [Izhakiella capsodis]
MGNEENQTSIHLFTALAITAIVAGRWMKDAGAPQRGVLRVPAFMANIFIRASHYWAALGNMAGSLPSGAAIPENTGTSQRAPAFEVDTEAELTREVCDAAVSCSSSIPRLTAFSSNSTASPEAYTRATVQNRPAPATGGNTPLSLPEQAHYLAVDKLRQESGLSDLLYCTDVKTESRQRINEKVVTNAHFNTKCDAIAYPEPLTKETDSLPVHTEMPETQVTSAETSRSGGEALLPLVTGAAVASVTTPYIQALKSKTTIAAGTSLGLFGLTVGGKALWNSLRSPVMKDADSAVPDTHSLVKDESVKGESTLQDCSRISKRDPGSNDVPYNNYYVSNMPCQKEFQIDDNIQSHNSVAALNEITANMKAIVGENNLRQYDSLEQLKNALNDQRGKILVRRIENALNEGQRRINNAYRKFVNPAAKDEILFYLSAALNTDNTIALEEAYKRLRRTALLTSMLVKYNIHHVSFFERRDKNIPLPYTRSKSPIVLVNKKDPAIIKINLEEAENMIDKLLVQQSSAGYDSKLMVEFIQRMIMLGGNTHAFVTQPECQNEQEASLRSYQQATDSFANQYQPTKALAGKLSVYPDDKAVRDILNKTEGSPLTDEMRNEAKNKLQNRQDEYYQRKTGKSAPSLHEQQQIVNDITWVFTGSQNDFETLKFFYDPIYRADIMTANTDSATIYLRDLGEDGIHAAGIEDNLATNPHFISFKQKAQELRNSFSDPYKVARNIAGNKIYQRTGQNLDPDTIFLHQFELSQTVEDSHSYTGFAHNGQPIHSETITQAYMDNFKVFRKRYQKSFMDFLNSAAAGVMENGYRPEHLDNSELSAPFFTGPDKLTGLYQVNSSAMHFGAENEVKYLPSVLKDDIYDANVMQQIEDQQRKFWSENSEAWRAMAKGQFIEEARLAYVNKVLSQQAYEIAIKGGAANIILYDPVTMRELNEYTAADPSVKVSVLNVRLQSSYLSLIEDIDYELTPDATFYTTNILCFTGKDEREVLYLPGENNPFREFKDEKELKIWFEQQIKKEETRNAFLQHLSLADRQKEVEASLNDLANGKIFADVRGYDQKPTIIKNSVKAHFDNEDAFSVLTQLTKERTEQDSDTLISSNGEIILNSVHQTLQMVSMLAMPILPMLGPVGIALDIGLTAAQLGTGIGLIYTADTQDEYNAAKRDVLVDVGMSLLFLGLNGVGAITANKNTVKSATSYRQTLSRADTPSLHMQSGSLQRIQSINEDALSGPREVIAGERRLQPVKKPFGEDLNFRWIDDDSEETKKILQELLYSRRESAVKLREFRQNPSGLCL